MRVEAGPITAEVVAEILPKLRPVDRLELDCMSRGDPAAALLQVAQAARRSMAVYIGGELIGIVGVNARTILSDAACPWALFTRAIERPDIRRILVRDSRRGVEWLAGGEFRRFWNLVAEENTAARRWLRWMGFRFNGVAVTLQGHRFLHFEKEV